MDVVRLVGWGGYVWGCLLSGTPLGPGMLNQPLESDVCTQKNGSPWWGDRKLSNAAT